jgi:hypothetical protein
MRRAKLLIERTPPSSALQVLLQFRGAMPINLPVILNAPPAVDCGGCTVCCDMLGVKELGKPYYARCQHLTPEKGCGAYDTRPNACRVFRCAWHLGLFDFKQQWRPDQCGLVFEIEVEGSTVYLQIYETAPGAADGDRALYLARRVLADKKFQRLTRGKNTLRLFRYGADVGIAYAVSPIYDYAPPALAAIPMKLTGGMSVFNGNHRHLLIPKTSI